MKVFVAQLVFPACSRDVEDLFPNHAVFTTHEAARKWLIKCLDEVFDGELVWRQAPDHTDALWFAGDPNDPQEDWGNGETFGMIIRQTLDPQE